MSQSKKQVTLVDVGNGFFNEATSTFIRKNAYLGFVLLSSFIEFLGKCIKQRTDFQEVGHSKEDYFDAINSLQSLAVYKQFNANIQKKENYLFSHLRCGMAHALLPQDNLILSSGNNDLSRNTIGAEDLFKDLKNAWDEIKDNPRLKEYLNQVQLVVVGNLSGSTSSQMTQIVDC